ncbi:MULTISPECIES: TetR/AcrR family transcriptional regulator [Nocardioides]|uniref:TetR/AcrR family transcriptional regulator n=1 Tax=Nocardioides vastitatis TaxID=2568655 RepID=A0ABW0ZIG3_9ACTN|nr:TetR/AcrR family transcriptional regulator [Nocardioides sp.]THJ07794.1 TetR/AcrR family transcriptional regulator [Nocardioides sp.]
MTADGTPHVLDGRRRRWMEHNQTRRQVIIDAAIAVLERQAPGEEVQVQAVADEASLSRTVIYRHFEDRADLDRAVQRQICEDLGGHLLPALSRDGRPEEIIHRVIEAYVRWASEHPALYWFAERDLSGWGPNPFAESLELVAVQIEGIMETVVSHLGAELPPNDRAGLDPWVFGMIGAVSGALRRWLNREVREPDAETFVEILSETVWLQIDGMATSRGINLPDLPVVELLQGLGPSDG